MDVDRATLCLACVVAWGGLGPLCDEIELSFVARLCSELPLEVPIESSGLWLKSDRKVAFPLAQSASIWFN